MAYNLLDLRTRVRTKIKDSSYSAATIDGYINDAIVEIADLYPWIYFQEVSSRSLTLHSSTITQPTDHQSTTKLVLIHPTQTTRFWDITKYRKVWEEFYDIYPAPENTTTYSQPIEWTEYGNQIQFNCRADLAYTLKQFYQRTPTELSANADVPDLPQNFREAIVLGASYRCEEERGNYDIATVIENRFGTKTGDLIMRFANDSMSGPDTIVAPSGDRDRW